jgi:uncharacterized protein (DUF3084 family)
MTGTYILIAAVLFLGGIIAVLGDRLGTKVGKARLRLFNLRPRDTAIVVTVLTGTLIAASTLGILLALSSSLRQGLFELEDIQKQRRLVTAELEKVTLEKDKVEQAKKEIEVALVQAKNKQAIVQNRLAKINKSYQQAKAQLKNVANQSKRLRSDIQKLLSERQQLLTQKTKLDQQITQLQDQVEARDRDLTKQERRIAEQTKILDQRKIRLQQLQNQRSKLQAEINQRDDRIAKLDKSISQKDRDLEVRSAKVQQLESQLTFLQKEVEALEQYYQNYQELREKNIAILRGQVLALGAVRVVDPQAAIQAINQLLTQANRMAIQLTNPHDSKANERVVQITKAEVEQLEKRLQDKQDYVVRIISSGNYVQGEKEVRVFADVVPNQEIFNQGDIVATVSFDSGSISEEDLQKRVDSLLAASQFRARSAGIVGTIQVEDGRIKTLLDFIDKISQSEQTLDTIRAVASENTYTVGPLRLRLVAIRNGKVLFSS